MKYLLDTCVISELVAKKPNKQVLNWIDGIDADSAYLSVITIGEVSKGIERLSDSSLRDELRWWLAEDVSARFSGRILVIDANVMLTWGKLAATLESVGLKIPVMDSLIAATAVCNGCQLVTRNVDDFKHSGLTIINPWQPRGGAGG